MRRMCPVPGTPVTPLPIGNNPISMPPGTLKRHIEDKTNPHSVTRQQIGISDFVKSAEFDSATGILKLLLMGPTSEIPLEVKAKVKGDPGLPATVYQVNNPDTGLWHKLWVRSDAFGNMTLSLDQTGEQVSVKYTVPPGGYKGQVLAKTSDADYMVGWENNSAAKSDAGGVYVEI